MTWERFFREGFEKLQPSLLIPHSFLRNEKEDKEGWIPPITLKEPFKTIEANKKFYTFDYIGLENVNQREIFKLLENQSHQCAYPDMMEQYLLTGRQDQTYTILGNLKKTFSKNFWKLFWFWPTTKMYWLSVYLDERPNKFLRHKL